MWENFWTNERHHQTLKSKFPFFAVGFDVTTKFFKRHQMGNFMVIVDENGFQAMGSTKEVLNMGSIQAKFESFGFSGLTIDGHNEREIDEAVRALWARDTETPKVLVAKTIKGKGVPFMEHDNRWHYTRLNDETYAMAIAAVTAGIKS